MPTPDRRQLRERIETLRRKVKDPDSFRALMSQAAGNSYVTVPQWTATLDTTNNALSVSAEVVSTNLEANPIQFAAMFLGDAHFRTAAFCTVSSIPFSVVYELYAATFLADVSVGDQLPSIILGEVLITANSSTDVFLLPRVLTVAAIS